MTYRIDWRSQEGYGDFISGLGYAHSSVIKYQQPVEITFHWPNPKDSLFSDIDTESITDRFDHILSYMKPVEGLSIKHIYSSIPEHRFINLLEEHNPYHGLWFPREDFKVEPKLVAFWSSKHNVKFPGYHKDPLHDHWHIVVENLQEMGYNVQEITYRTPIKQTMELISKCEFGIGYEGMVHQLFKFMWKPIVIASQRVKLTKLLAVQGAVVTSPDDLFDNGIMYHVAKSERNVQYHLKRYMQYLNNKQDPTKHTLYRPI